MSKLNVRCLFLLLVAAGVSKSAAAQITTGAVTGIVTDAQGGEVPGATVVLTSETLGTKSRPVVTNSVGSYTVPQLTADTYTVEVTMSGFNSVSRKGIEVSGGDRVTVPTVALTVAGQTETVVVRAEAPFVQAATDERSSALQREQRESLPVLSHSFIDFVGLQPGVNRNRGGNQQQRTARGGQDNIMLGGVSALDTGNTD